MKTLSTVFAFCLVLALVSGCTLTRGSSIAVGTKRQPVDASKVKLYLKAPATFEEVGLVSADGRNAFASAQNLMDNAIERLKKEAGKLGANGVLLTGAGDQYGGSVGTGFGTATVNGGMVVASGVSSSSAVVNKAVSGMAIFVTKE